MHTTSIRKTLTREFTLLLLLLFAGMVLLPVAIYLVGQPVFGEYGGGGIGEFFGTLYAALRRGDPVVWYLVLSPYVAWQLLRLTTWGFRRSHIEK